MSARFEREIFRQAEAGEITYEEAFERFYEHVDMLIDQQRDDKMLRAFEKDGRDEKLFGPSNS